MPFCSLCTSILESGRLGGYPVSWFPTVARLQGVIDPALPRLLIRRIVNSQQSGPHYTGYDYWGVGTAVTICSLFCTGDFSNNPNDGIIFSQILLNFKCVNARVTYYE
jgi:hypothetical protein